MFTNKHITTDYGGNLVTAAASGQCVAFPPGTYTFTGAEVFASSTKFVGAGCDLTNFSIDTASAIRVAGANASTYIGQVGFHDCSFVSTMATANPMLSLENITELRLDNVKVYCPNRWFANMDNVVGADIVNLYITQASNGLLIGNQSSCSRLNFDGFVIRQVTSIGVQIVQGIAISFDSPKIMQSNAPIIIQPNAAGRIVSAIQVSNYVFNAVAINGLYITPQSGGSVSSIRFSNGILGGTAAAGSYGAFIEADASSQCDDIIISKTYCGNFGREGFYIGRSSNVRMNECTVGGNSKSAVGTYPGATITANALYPRINGGRYGDYHGATPSQSYGVVNNSITARIRVGQAINNVSGRVLDNARSLI